MLKITQEDSRLIVDVREAIQKGFHPREDIVNTVKQAAKGTIIELHLPHRAQPLVNLLESMGMNCIIHELEPDHFRLTTVKMN